MDYMEMLTKATEICDKIYESAPDLYKSVLKNDKWAVAMLCSEAYYKSQSVENSLGLTIDAMLRDGRSNVFIQLYLGVRISEVEARASFTSKEIQDVIRYKPDDKECLIIRKWLSEGMEITEAARLTNRSPAQIDTIRRLTVDPGNCVARTESNRKTLSDMFL